MPEIVYVCIEGNMSKQIKSWRDIEQADKSNSLEKWLFIPDTHAPFHSKKHFNLMLRAAEGFRPDGICIGGDFLDCYEISLFDKDPRRMRQGNLLNEIKVGNQLLDLVDGLGAEKKIFLSGNHCFRLDKYITKNAPALVGIPGLSIPELLNLKSRGWKHVPYRNDIRIGKINVTHDVGSSGPTAYVAARNDYGGNAIINHIHTMGLSFKSNYKGETHVGAAFGWLGDDKYIDYTHSLKAKQWVSGFGVGYKQNNGVVHLNTCPIVNGAVVVGGVLYK
jgi:hypothetical protein